jgi:hypothetical protein
MSDALDDSRRRIGARDVEALGQNSAGHAAFSVPAHEINFAHAETQSGEKCRAHLARNSDIVLWTFPEAHQQQEEGTIGTLCTCPLDFQEVSEGLLVVEIAESTIESVAKRRR